MKAPGEESSPWNDGHHLYRGKIDREANHDHGFNQTFKIVCGNRPVERPCRRRCRGTGRRCAAMHGGRCGPLPQICERCKDGKDGKDGKDACAHWACMHHKCTMEICPREHHHH